MATPVERSLAALRRRGVPVGEHRGWRSRAHLGAFTPRAIMFHHDGSALGPSPSVVDVIADGRSDLAGPLSQFWVDTGGRWWVVANGLAWHAGIGAGWGDVPRDSGNRYSFGVETDHTIGESWPAVMYDSLVAGFAAICVEFNLEPRVGVVAHREYAPGRKVDPDGVDMAGFRLAVKARMVTGEDWFSMATVNDLKAALRAVLKEHTSTGELVNEVRRELQDPARSAPDLSIQALKNSLDSQSVRLTGIEAALETIERKVSE